MGKRGAAVALIATIAAGIVGFSANGAGASASESSFVSRINHERSSRGLRSLTVRSDLVSVARRHSVEMAHHGDIYHNSHLASEVGGPWTELGENVGVGPDVSTLHTAFMQSTSHRANILHRSYNEVGIGVAYGSDGEMYVTEVFATRHTVTRHVTTRATTRRTTSRPTTRGATPAASVATAAPVKHVPVADPAPEPRTVDLLARLMGE